MRTHGLTRAFLMEESEARIEGLAREGSTPQALIARRMESARSLADALLVLMTLGDERIVRATYVMGRRLHGGDTGDRAQSSH